MEKAKGEDESSALPLDDAFAPWRVQMQVRFTWHTTWSLDVSSRGKHAEDEKRTRRQEEPVSEREMDMTFILL